jgi:16S rRNA (guanine1207-N2)-methyltransferase
MSGPARPLAETDDPALDAGVLANGPVVEWHGWQAVCRHGGTAVLPWRGDHLAATAAGLTTAGDGSELVPGSCPQALVRIQKGRDATWNDLAQAWQALAEGGRLLVTGGNELGIATWVKRLSEVLGQPGEILANHSRARVACFRRMSPRLDAPASNHQVPLWPSTWERGLLPAPVAFTVDAQREARAPGVPRITVPPGVFSHGELDGGTALLLAHLADESPAERVLDLGCGAGHLGLHALLRWPQAHAWFVDADARAMAAVHSNLSRLGAALPDRGTALWWDVSEPLPIADLELVLCNPPCHAGTTNDYATAQAMFRLAAAALVRGGRLLVVANRQLPYEADLARLGTVDIRIEQRGFKILRLRRD